ncbi:hypothetical protein [Bifidobacterium simiarum]|uniref:hypothetical protein n=1 Tax=Bifidobacterium simiarum TaxID=2045441 RepID=UPI001BDD3C52|nr:hypothetical protein [Bifidobacterium simiarum]MBT1166969.1 hypothetical protein [Bifidobacterium simiarum]
MPVVYAALSVGLLFKGMPFLESTVVLGHSALAGGSIVLGVSDVISILCLLIAV